MLSIYKNDVEQIFKNYASTYGKQKITKESMVATIITYFSEQDRKAAEETKHPEFAREYFLRSIADTNFSKINILSANVPPVKKLPDAYLNKFTFRHYTANGSATERPGYIEIKSAMTLSIEAVLLNSSGHTTGLDWSGIGNVADTFYALCYNGKPIDTPKFIQNAKYYMEFTPAEIGDIWVSPDWLPYAAETGKNLSYPQNMTYEGNAEAVLSALFPWKSCFGDIDEYIQG